MVVNDDAGNLAPHGALRFIVETPPGAGSLLQGIGVFTLALRSSVKTPPRRNYWCVQPPD
ncbi:hypothetical protein C4E44_15850 [Pseudomonas sp. MWU12-2312b]|nr:hypothetical protein C4E44_15850 [Pseudomonas sp. MWU12-2312b]